MVSIADRDGLEGGLAMGVSKWEVFCQVLPVLGPHEKEDPKWSLSQNGNHSLYMFARSGPSDSLTEDPFPGWVLMWVTVNITHTCTPLLCKYTHRLKNMGEEVGWGNSRFYAKCPHAI